MKKLPTNDPNAKEPEGLSFYQFAGLLAFIGLVVTIILLTPWGRIFH